MRKMKDSGVEWIGKIPEEWKVFAMKMILVRNDGGVWGDDTSEEKNNVIVLRSTEQTIDGKWDIVDPAHRDLSSIGNIEYYRCKVGDLLITKSSGSDLHIGKTTIVDETVEKMNCCYSNFLQRIRVGDKYVPRLMWYIFNSSIVREQFVYMQNSTSGIGNLNAKYISEVRVPISSKEEQKKIVNYLDSKCAKIDSIIAKQEQIIEKLKEYKLSLITEAVTKGLDPNVEMKDSGIEWMGKIPKQWSTPKIKLIAEISSGGTPDRNVPEYWNGNINWLKTGELQNNYIYDAEEKITELALKESSAKIFPVNTVLIAMYGQGKTRGMTGFTKVPSATNQACAGIVVRTNKMDAEFLWESLKGSYKVLRELALGSGQPNLSGTLISDFYVTMPTIQEQKRIITVIRKKTEKIDNIVNNKEEQLKRLQEYKKSLIYEVVTGKKEV